MSSDFFEIVELNSGKVVLRRVDDDGNALVTIEFSNEAKAFLGDMSTEIGRVMMGAGLQAANQIKEESHKDELEDVVVH